MNAFAERWVLSVKSECLDHTRPSRASARWVPAILFGEHSLRRALREYCAYHHVERPHQGLGNELIDGKPSTGNGDVVAHERLGGLLNSYHRTAA